MKVVLSTPPGRTTELWPPLGLLYVASSCLQRREGSDDIKVIDAFCENLTEAELVSRIGSERPDVLGMNCSTHTFLDTISTLRAVDEAMPETKLVLGGMHATFASEMILRDYPFVDYIVVGEGEESFPRLLNHIDEGTPPSDVPGIGFTDNGQPTVKPDSLIEDLDTLPFPDRSLLPDIDYGYTHENIRLTYGKFTTISSSRGCPFRCSYCSCAAFSKRIWRPRSPENVVDELERMYGDGYECCVFVDDNLTLNRGRMERICELIRERKVKMQFYCEGRVDNTPYSLMRQMKQAGFNVMYFGVESGQKHVLNYYRKMIDVGDSRRAVADAKRAGMIVVTSYIMGAPVETKDDMDKTIDLIRAMRAHGVQINILDCLVGTDIWSELERDGAVGADDWKTNHRIYEYSDNGITRADLEAAVNRGYTAYLDAWKSVEGVKELVKTVITNRTARTVVARNLLNPHVRIKISDGRRFK
ncbi:MAG TPA: radical SAM protein [Thermoplasmata archaeon]|nr:radical SAM protein [Thermoplasmata archaeon]